MNQTPSVARIVQVDYLSSLGALFPAVSWGLALVGRFFDPEAAAFFLRASPFVTVAGLVVLLWRALTIRSVFEGGSQVPGVVSRISFFRGRGRIRYVYTYEGQKYQTGNALQSTRHTRALQQGQTVTVVVDRFKPGRAFVRELYL